MALTMSSSTEIPMYLIEYLNEIAKEEGFIQHTLQLETAHTDGFVGIMIAVTVTGIKMVNKQVELHLMCKLLPDNKYQREYFNSTAVFEREVLVYTEILPMFEKFQIEKNILTDDGFFSYPKCYVAVADTDKDRYIIIMENLKTSGYEFLNQMTPVDFETSSIILSLLGRLHGLSFAFRDQKPDIFRKLEELQNPITILNESPNFVATVIAGIETAIGNSVCDNQINLLKIIKNNYHPIVERSFAVSKFPVLNHGDCKSNNFCFRKDENKKSREICLYDWQTSGVSSPALDLSYYLLLSTTKKLRKDYNELLTIYYDSLSTLVTKLGSDPSTLFPFEELKNELEHFSTYSVVMVPIILQVISSGPRHIQDINIHKDSQHLDLTKTDDSIKITDRERVSDALHDAVKFGWINL